MAFGLRHWLMVAAAASGLLAVAKLPPEPFARESPTPGRPPTQEAVRYSALRREASGAREALRRLRWSDSLSARLVREARDGWAAGTVALGTVEAQVDDSVRAAFERQLPRVPERREDVVIGAFLVDDGFGDHPAVAPELGVAHPRWSEEAYMGERDGVAYCVNAVGYNGKANWNGLQWSFARSDQDGEPRHNHLGICRWVAQFGLPGPGVDRWVRTGGLALVHEPSTERWSPPSWFFGNAQLGGRRRGLFGLFAMWGAERVDACLAGYAEPCAAMFADPLSTARFSGDGDSPDPVGAFLGTTDRWRFGDELHAWGWILADLYAEFGAERTRKFWTSPSDDVLTAFRDAFGVDAGAWVARWVRGYAGYVPPGPLPRGNTWLWSLGAVLVCAGIAAGAARWRTVA